VIAPAPDSRPRQHDLAYISTLEGWLHLAVVLNLRSRTRDEARTAIRTYMSYIESWDHRTAGVRAWGSLNPIEYER
jgi:hypothetical protein